MKKIYLIVAICTSAFIANAQVFWTEDFGTGCNTGQLANAYTGTNGAWTVASTGTNDPYANVFYVDAEEAGNAIGMCGSGCTGTVDATLHISTAVALTGDVGAAYFSGGFCGSGLCAVTNTRAESPIINCTGRTSITLSCGYFENGQTTLDDASLWYSPDGGTTWSLLDNMAKTTLGTCAPQGMWTAYSFALPASANNNAFVKIGFNWTNNDDAVGTDPSFAVDDIALSTPSVGIANATSSSVEVFANGSNVIIKSNNVVQLQGVYDVLGRTITSTLENNTINLEAQPAGVYFVRVIVKEQVYTKKIFIK